MFKELTAVALFLLATDLVKGQSGPVIAKVNKPAQVIEELAIGTEVPDIPFNNVLNSSASSLRLSDFKGKVVVLDFWATFCTPCIKKMPYLDSIQKLNEDLVKIIVISRDNLSDDKNRVSSFMQKYKSKFKDFNLPVVPHDSIASQYFPHKIIPHYVWIDKDGTFLATTSGDELNTEIIKKVYEGKHVDFSIKREFMQFKKNVPLFSEGNGGKERHVKYKSLITGYVDGIGGSYYTDLKDGLATRLFIRNAPLLSLFRDAYGVQYPLSQIVLDVKDENRFISDKSKNWGKENSYCYELITSPSGMDKIRKLLQHDLYAYFGMTGKIETRKVKCLVVLKKDPSGSKPIEPAAANINSIHSVDDLVMDLNKTGRVPVFNGVESKALIMLDYNGEALSGLQEVRDILNKKGLKLVEEEREVSFLVIKEE